MYKWIYLDILDILDIYIYMYVYICMYIWIYPYFWNDHLLRYMGIDG